MLRRCVPLAAIFLAIVVSIASADEILVPSSDRDRVIRLNDGRQIRLQAGKELVRTSDGRLVTRSLAPEQRQTPQAAAQTARRTPQQGADKSDRWIYYVGAQGSTRSINHERKIATNDLPGHPTIDDRGGPVIADGNTTTRTTNLSESGFAAAFGVKDTQEQNYYELSIGKSDKLTEVSLGAAIGFPSLAFLDNKAVPYARALVGAGFEDGLSSFDAFSYGAGIGLNYAINQEVEVFGEANYIMRKFGEKVGVAKNPSTGASEEYGKINKNEKETRLSIGARYLFN